MHSGRADTRRAPFWALGSAPDWQVTSCSGYYAALSSFQNFDFGDQGTLAERATGVLHWKDRENRSGLDGIGRKTFFQVLAGINHIVPRTVCNNDMVIDLVCSISVFRNAPSKNGSSHLLKSMLWMR